MHQTNIIQYSDAVLLYFFLVGMDKKYAFRHFLIICFWHVYVFMMCYLNSDTNVRIHTADFRGQYCIFM